MDFCFSPEEEEFRQEVGRFLYANVPSDLKSKRRRNFTTRDEYLAWHRLLHKQGWVAPLWPKEYGGAGWTITQRYIFDEECAKAEAPRLVPFGVAMCGPVIIAFGNEAQRKKYLPRILSGEDWWCQGYSEPGAGSDLASLTTRGVRAGDHYVINGRKTWITLAQFADWMFCLVRTDRVTFLLIDMQSPGITIRPIAMLDGAHELNEVVFEDVKVPAENRIGEENKGWVYARYLLARERSGIAGVAGSKKALRRLHDISAAERPDGTPLVETNTFSRKIAELEIDLAALEWTELRTLASESKAGRAGPESSILKIKGTEIQQRITELTLEAIGYYGYPDARGLAANEHPVGPDDAAGRAGHYFNMRKASIYGGTNEIQRNIIARAVLGI